MGKIKIDMSSYNDIPDYLGYVPDCPSCGGEMGYSYCDSEFKCSQCGKKFDENDFNFDNEDTSDIPFCCTTCGGPYPQCMTSCKMFDD